MLLDVVTLRQYWNLVKHYKEILQYLKQLHKKTEECQQKNTQLTISFKCILVLNVFNFSSQSINEEWTFHKFELIVFERILTI